MKHLRNVAFAFVAMICGSITTASAEKWSCDMEMSTKGKAYKQEWVVSGDRMFAPKGKGYLRVVLNNNDMLFAFLITPKDLPQKPFPAMPAALTAPKSATSL
jgi:hypothetical protein